MKSDATALLQIDPALDCHGLDLVAFRLTDEPYIFDENQREYEFTARVRSTGGHWPFGKLRVQCYDEAGLLTNWCYVGVVDGLSADEKHLSAVLQCYPAGKAELIFEPSGDAGVSAPAQASVVHVPQEEASSAGPTSTQEERRLVGVSWLRDVGDTDRVSKADLAQQLEQYVDQQPETARVIDDLAWVLSRMTPSPYLPLPETAWSWPRPEWKDWADAMEAILDGVPMRLWRRLRVTAAEPKGCWAEITGRHEEFFIAIHDPKGKFTNLRQLEWTPEGLLAGSSLIWRHDYSMVYASGAVDRLAQGLALGAGMASPATLTVLPLVFD